MPLETRALARMTSVRVEPIKRVFGPRSFDFWPLNKTVVVHEEDLGLSKDFSMHEGVVSTRLGLKQKNEQHNSAAIFGHFEGVERRPPEAHRPNRSPLPVGGKLAA